jgi:anthranilate synthase component 1
MPVSPPSNKTALIRRFDAADYEAAVRRTKDYILAGDCMQVVIGQRISKPFTESPLALYRALRSLNPSPYMYFYDFGDLQVVGSSPEILVRQELRESQKIVTIRPLAGTRHRGTTPEEDARLATELLADPKEIAEHVMLIDLARNDVGRIAKTGTVKVTDSMVIEKYSHVQHIVSSVEGELLDNMSNMNVLRATFPAGTLSGAPKIRAMEIIDEMEITKRGIYGGAAGYLSFSGDMDVAIVIRTGVIRNGMLHSQAGAGVVADSDPAAEWRETEAKARAVLMAADLVQGGLDAPHD